MISKMRYFIYKDIKYYHGEKVTCVLNELVVKDARIALEFTGQNNYALVCQDYCTNTFYSDGSKFGYRFSWCVVSGTETDSINLKKLKTTNTLGEVIYSVLEER